MSGISTSIWLEFGGLVSLALAVGTSTRVLLRKRDVRAAIGWIGLIWLVPVFGPVLYLLLGINRIERRAAQLRPDRTERASTVKLEKGAAFLREHLPAPERHLEDLARLVDNLTGVPLTGGNRVAILANAGAAYAAMIEAIDSAARSVVLSTYIFGNDEPGTAVADALVRAVGRGVEVRVLLDGMGAWYTSPRRSKTLAAKGVRIRLFLHSLIPWRMPYLNMRSHHKILVIDGKLGFTGSLNIGSGNLSRMRPQQDLHFRFEGPVVRQMMQVFARDWTFTSRERLEGADWYPDHLEDLGHVVARGIASGPDQQTDTLRLTLLAALGRARRSVWIVTPYFLPDARLITALNLAALRGLRVEIILPEKSNLPPTQWACNAQLWQMVNQGCNVSLSPPPFDHSKLVVVDETWVLAGSANWDERSLRLNFEFNIEAYDAAFAGSLMELVLEKRRRATPVTWHDLERRPLPIKLRDGLARLFLPYM